MSPPAATATTKRRRTAQAVTRNTLVRDTHAVLAACGIDRSPAWVSTLVGKYRHSPMRGLPFGQYLAARLELNAQQRADMLSRPESRYVLTYADHTGEDAARNVDRERGWPGNGPH